MDLVLVEVSQLRDWFTVFNKTYFGGALPEPAFAVGRSRTRLGSLSWRYKRVLLSRRPYGYVIRISNYYDLDERRLKSVLLHEMIHLHIVSKGLRDTSPHGVLFRKEMDAINADGWLISVSAKMKAAACGKGVAGKRSRVVLAVRMSDGRCLLSVVNPRYVGRIDSVVRRSAGVAASAWYVSDDGYFADFPAVRSPKGRVVPADTFARLVGLMKPFVHDSAGARIK